jgi:AcrR family transcriptional regulator
MNNQDKSVILGKPYPQGEVRKSNGTKERILLTVMYMFAKDGYTGVSMRDIAREVGIKPASLYNHFSSKEALWDAILDRICELYAVYFKRLKQANRSVKSFKEMLHNMLVELKTVVQVTIYYGIALIQSEQFHNRRAGEVLNKVVLNEGIVYIEKEFNRAIKEGMVKPFDAQMMAMLIMCNVLINNNLRVHEHLRRKIPYDVKKMYSKLEEFVLEMVNK